MLIMPLSGYVASNFSKWGVNFFNALKLPPWGVESEAVYNFLNTTHVLTSYVFVTLIAIHILAALRHLFRRDDIFARMTLGGTRGVRAARDRGAESPQQAR